MPGGLRHLGEVLAAVSVQRGPSTEASPDPTDLLKSLGPGPFLEGLRDTPRPYWLAGARLRGRVEASHSPQTGRGWQRRQASLRRRSTASSTAAGTSYGPRQPGSSPTL